MQATHATGVDTRHTRCSDTRTPLARLPTLTQPAHAAGRDDAGRPGFRGGAAGAAHGGWAKRGQQDHVCRILRECVARHRQPVQHDDGRCARPCTRRERGAKRSVQGSACPVVRRCARRRPHERLTMLLAKGAPTGCVWSMAKRRVACRRWLVGLTRFLARHVCAGAGCRFELRRAGVQGRDQGGRQPVCGSREEEGAQLQGRGLVKSSSFGRISADEGGRATRVRGWKERFH